MCALIFRSFLLVSVQGVFIFFVFILTRTCLLLRVRIHPKEIIPLIPVLLFVFTLNCFRGGGELLFRYGPILLLKQGIIRGSYYVAVIIELFLMSRLLTRAFSSELLLGSLSTLDLFLFRAFRNRKGNFFLVLYYVIGIFSHVYAELKIFFRATEQNLKQKTVIFFRSVFEKSLIEFDEGNRAQMMEIRPKRGDFLLVSVQIAAFVVILIFQDLYALGFHLA